MATVKPAVAGVLAAVDEDTVQQWSSSDNDIQLVPKVRSRVSQGGLVGKDVFVAHIS